MTFNKERARKAYWDFKNGLRNGFRNEEEIQVTNHALAVMIEEIKKLSEELNTTPNCANDIFQMHCFGTWTLEKQISILQNQKKDKAS